MKKAPVARTGTALKKLANNGYEAAGVMLEVLVDEDELDELDEENDESLDVEDDELLDDEEETADIIASKEVSRVSSAIDRVAVIGSSVVVGVGTISPVVCIPVSI